MLLASSSYIYDIPIQHYCMKLNLLNIKLDITQLYLFLGLIVLIGSILKYNLSPLKYGRHMFYVSLPSLYFIIYVLLY